MVGWRGTCGVYQPTFDDASVRLFNVVDLPEEGFPTRPIRGSRGIIPKKKFGVVEDVLFASYNFA